MVMITATQLLIESPEFRRLAENLPSDAPALLAPFLNGVAYIRGRAVMKALSWLGTDTTQNMRIKARALNVLGEMNVVGSLAGSFCLACLVGANTIPANMMVICATVNCAIGADISTLGEIIIKQIDRVNENAPSALRKACEQYLPQKAQ